MSQLKDALDHIAERAKAEGITPLEALKRTMEELVAAQQQHVPDTPCQACAAKRQHTEQEWKNHPGEGREGLRSDVGGRAQKGCPT